jgi:cellulose synthase/poly-beta-1,6-N-acetylglucosamine synthase-like glycosyltransferase
MWIRAWRGSRRISGSVSELAIEPTVTIVVVAHNEGRRIDARLTNLLEIDYPRDRVEIILASDGSTDDTVERARAFESAGVTVHAFERRRGKPAVLDELVPKATGEIILLADARQQFDRAALRALVRHFADGNVGAVSGELVLMKTESTSAAGDGAGFYWRYEKLIRRSESCCDSTVGATGAIYAIRRSLFEPIPEDTILDDVLIPMKIARRGYRVLFESEARAYDKVAANAREEFTRKVRTIAGNFQLLARERWLLSPRKNRLWFQTISHKGARLLSPVWHVLAFAANAAVAAEPVFGVLLAGQVVFYAVALGGFALRDAQRHIPLISVPYAICLLCCATVVAFVRYVNGRQAVTWDHARV